METVSGNSDSPSAFAAQQPTEVTLTLKEDDDDAYDGSSAPPSRELTARERDVVCRVFADIRAILLNGGGMPGTGNAPVLPVRGFNTPEEVAMLFAIPEAIDPRRESSYDS